LKSNITQLVEQLLLPYLNEHGFELVEVEYVKEGGRRFLRVYVDKEGGIDIDDCGRISEYLSERLDEADPIPEAYFLEVSSPGAERPLKKPEDFNRAVGRHVLITTYEPVDGRKEFEGTLVAYDGEQASVQIGAVTHRIPVNRIAGARLAVII
jgi:ribosome maturation factor RimP